MLQTQVLGSRAIIFDLDNCLSGADEVGTRTCFRRTLGFASLFEAIHVDALDAADRKEKEGIFKDILKTYHLSPEEVLVVGDNLDSEIKAGKRLGMRTVQIIREGVPRGSGATHYIHSLCELRGPSR